MVTHNSNSAPRFIEAGQALLKLDPEAPLHEQGKRVYAQAMESACDLPVQLALVWAPPLGLDEHRHAELLAGMREAAMGEVAEDEDQVPPMLGCTAPWVLGGAAPIAHQDSVVVTVLRARTEYFSVLLGVGEDAVQSPEAAALLACARADISAASMARCDGLVLSILPGLRHGADGDTDRLRPTDNSDARLVKQILAVLGSSGASTFSVFGGSSADRSGGRVSWQYAMFRPFRDSVVVAKVMTRLNFGMGISHGFSLEPNPIRVTGAEPDETRIIAELDGQPAGQRVRMSPQQPVILGLMDAQLVYGPQKLYINGENDEQAIVNWPVASSGIAHEMSLTRAGALRAVDEASRQVAIRGMLARPKFALAIACAGRASVVDDPGLPRLESERLRRLWGDQVTVTGFYARGELCRTAGHADYAENYAYALLVIDDELYPTVRMRQRLSFIDDMRLRLAAAVSEARQATSPEEVVIRALRALEPPHASPGGWPALGGMVSMLQPMTGAQQHIVGYKATSRWDAIRQATNVSRTGDDQDILSLVLNSDEPQFIPNSLTDPRVSRFRMNLAKPGPSDTGPGVQGQVVMRLVHPRTHMPIGTLQVELPLGYAPMPIEIRIVADYARQISAAFCEAVEQRERINRLTRLAALVLKTDLSDALSTLAKVAREALSGDWCCLGVTGLPCTATADTPPKAIELIANCDPVAAEQWADDNGHRYASSRCPAWPSPALVQIMVGPALAEQPFGVAAMRYLLAQLVSVVSIGLARESTRRVPSLAEEEYRVVKRVHDLLDHHASALLDLADTEGHTEAIVRSRCRNLYGDLTELRDLVRNLVAPLGYARRDTRRQVRTVDLCELAGAAAADWRRRTGRRAELAMPRSLPVLVTEVPLKQALLWLLRIFEALPGTSVRIAVAAEPPAGVVTITLSPDPGDAPAAAGAAGDDNSTKRALYVYQAGRAALGFGGSLERPDHHCYILRIPYDPG
ncbi:MAG: hypothetical protein HZB16_05600 [Armatimonadetes bacterium]|nr:hypothetical protein [Armatimonadota bacterium]